MNKTKHTNYNSLYQRLLKEPNLPEKLIKIAQDSNYPIFVSNNAYPMNLNIWGIRSNSIDTKHFNDVIVVFYNGIFDEGNARVAKWICHIFEATTDPSDLILRQPINKKGTAILSTGYHPRLWKIGKHKGAYNALVQANPTYVYRDNNEDVIMDLDTLEYGTFGINLHRASSTRVQDEIGHYSAGCQVIKDVNEWNKVFIPLVKKAVGKGYQSYVLINEVDID